MQPSAALICIFAALLLGACSTQQIEPSPARADNHLPVVTVAGKSPGETILLVSLDDGSVIMQTINTGADICFKSISDSATTCLTRGKPIRDPRSNSIIGFEMIEEQIQLVGKSP